MGLDFCSQLDYTAQEKQGREIESISLEKEFQVSFTNFNLYGP